MQNNISELKEVTNLTIIGEGMTVTYESSTLINGSTVSIPLKTDADATTFSFILNYGNSTPALVNEDVLKFIMCEKSYLYPVPVVLKLIIP
jgi:hypothetical protein